MQTRPSQFRRASADTSHPHLFPVPRLRQGDFLRANGLATAAIDLSDGLSTDLRHLCDESSVGAIVDAAALPLHPLLYGTEPDEALRLALHGGEDYELLFTARPMTRVPRSLGGVAMTRIGTITRDRDFVLLAQTGKTKPLVSGGWKHSL